MLLGSLDREKQQRQDAVSCKHLYNNSSIFSPAMPNFRLGSERTRFEHAMESLGILGNSVMNVTSMVPGVSNRR